MVDFTRIQKAKKIKCSLKLPVKIRYRLFINCLESLKNNKTTLQNLAVSNDINVSKLKKYLNLLKTYTYMFILFKIIEKLDKTVKQKIP
jgi:hypothetical protein